MTLTPSLSPATHYDRVTAAWELLLGDELHYGVFAAGIEDLPAATAALTDLMLEKLAAERGQHVLDVGCGVGTQACRLAADHGLRVTGISTSRVGLDAATARARAMGVQSLVSFQERDGTDNGLGDECFDRVWVLESSHLMRRRERLLTECVRVLRPGGRLALCDIVLRRPLSLADVRRLRQPLLLLRDVFGDAQMQPLAQYTAFAESAGLIIEDELDLTATTRPTFQCWRDNADRHAPQVDRLLGADGRQRFVDACSVLERFWDDGTLGYGLIAGTRRP